MTANLFFALFALIASVAGHGYVKTITIGNSEPQPGFVPVDAPWYPVQDTIAWANWATDSGFVSAYDLQHPDIICHVNSSSAQKSAQVAAGEHIVLEYNTWPASHHGPVITYLADCDGDCSSVDKTALRWFKFAEEGQLELGPGSGQPGRWADGKLLENDFTWTVTVPEAIAPGNYVLRNEIIALHSGLEEGGAQFYPSCINLQVTGHGSAVPEGVLGTNLYHTNDEGVLYNIYNDEKIDGGEPTYVIPGPKLWKL